MGKKGALIEIAGEFFKSKRKHFAFETLYKQVENMKEFKKLTLFSSLESVSLNGTNINDEGLKYLNTCNSINNLNLTFTSISDKGIAHLISLSKLEYLRLKETNITTKGLLNLNNKSLEELFLSDASSQEDIINLKHLSRKIPTCKIIVKNNGEFLNGFFEKY
jgi:hypothetical protein